MAVLFSVIIPTFNRATLLSDTLRSVLCQTYKNWECIVVDDGSTDNTKEIVLSFSDKRIKYYYKKHEERSIARNYGIERANGKYVCFLDSDDEYYINHLFVLYKKIKEEGFPTAIFNTGINEYRSGMLVERPNYNASIYSHPVNFIWQKFMLINSVCVSREILNEHQFPQFNVWEDTHLWLRVVAQYPFFQIQEITSQWNIHKEGSVVKAFEEVDSRHVENYLRCIAHLFHNYRMLLKPFLNCIDMHEYQFSKLKMFLDLSFNRGQYKSFFKLYFMGLQFVKKRKLTKYVSQKIKKRLKRRIISKLTY